MINDNTEKLYFSDKQCLKEFLTANKDSGTSISRTYYIPTGSYIIRISYTENGVANAFEIIGEGSSIITSDVKPLTDINDILSKYKYSQSLDLSYLSEFGDLQSIDSMALSIAELFPGS